MIRYIVRRFVTMSLLAAAVTISPCSRAITILSGPTFVAATNAPLAGTLSLTTDVPSRVSVLVSDGTNVWEKDFYDYGTTHSETLLGFKPDQTNQILVAVYDENRNMYTAPDLLTFVTPSLPADFPTWTVLKSEPDQMEPGYTLFTIMNRNSPNLYITIMDNSGAVVWYRPIVGALYDIDVRQLDNGDLFIPQNAPSNSFLEINMLGETVRTWNAPTNYPVNLHDGVLTDHGTILYLSDILRSVSNFPSSLDTNATPITTNVDDNPVVEISATNSSLLNTWSPLDILDPTRITYLTYMGSGSSIGGVDNEHGNAVLEDTNDGDAIIESLRDQNAVFKFSRTGQLKWILGPHAGWGTNWQPYLLKPVGTPFDWNYGQHAPMLTPQGTLILYDDNNYAASPFVDPIVPDQSNYSSAIEYDINETNMTVSEVWNSSWQTNQDRLFTGIVGKAQWLPQTRDILVTYGYVDYINGVHPSPYSANATMVRIIEYTHDPIPQIVFDLSFFDYGNTSPSYNGNLVYRALRIPDLYPHPAAPVTDLAVHDVDQIPILEFSADPAHSYLVQASTDLTHWTTIGTPVEEGGVGDYDFEDLDAGQYTARYYRVVTQ